jgi:hypothetical protein
VHFNRVLTIGLIFGVIILGDFCGLSWSQGFFLIRWYMLFGLRSTVARRCDKQVWVFVLLVLKCLQSGRCITVDG